MVKVSSSCMAAVLGLSGTVDAVAQDALVQPISLYVEAGCSVANGNFPEANDFDSGERAATTSCHYEWPSTSFGIMGQSAIVLFESDTGINVAGAASLGSSAGYEINAGSFCWSIGAANNANATFYLSRRSILRMSQSANQSLSPHVAFDSRTLACNSSVDALPIPPYSAGGISNVVGASRVGFDHWDFGSTTGREANFSDSLFAFASPGSYRLTTHSRLGYVFGGACGPPTVNADASSGNASFDLSVEFETCLDVSNEPGDVTTCFERPVSFSVTASGAPEAGAIQYEWLWTCGDGNFRPVLPGPNTLNLSGLCLSLLAELPVGDGADPDDPIVIFEASGENSPSMTVTPRFPGITFVCVVSNDCDSYTTTEASVAFNKADWFRDGVLDSNDFLEYLNDWLAREPAADIAPGPPDGSWDSSDFLAFLNDFVTGC